MQMLEATGRDAGGETQPHRALTATCCQSPVLSAIPPAHPQAVLGHGDGVFILFCLNELVCVRLGNGGRGILETSTWGMYPWRSECQATFGWLKTIKVQRAVLCQLCSSVSSANTPCVLCWALHSPTDRFCCIQAQIFPLFGCCHGSPGMPRQLQQGPHCNTGRKKSVFIVCISTANDCTQTPSCCGGTKPCTGLRWGKAKCCCF